MDTERTNVGKESRDIERAASLAPIGFFSGTAFFGWVGRDVDSVAGGIVGGVEPLASG